MGNRALYGGSLLGTKHLVEDYLREVTDAMRWLSEGPFRGVSAGPTSCSCSRTLVSPTGAGH